MTQGNDLFRLVVRRGPQPNQVYDLTKDSTTLGRDITNDIVINDPEVSRHHLRLTRAAGGISLEDLGSTNGTFINGQRLSGSRALRSGDMVGLGETVTLAYEQMSSQTVTMPSGEAPPGPTIPNTVQRPPATSQPYSSTQSAQYQPSQPVNPYAPPNVSGGQPPAYSPPSYPSAETNLSGYSPQQVPYVQPSQPVSPYAAPPPAGSGYTSMQQPYGAPAAPGATDYDPYAVREEEGSNTTRLVLIGCVGLSLFCCCGTLIGAVLVDQLCLYSNLPIVYDVLRALGYVATC